MSDDIIVGGKYIVKKDCMYAESHEFIKPIGDGLYLFGISDYAVKMLNEITYVELPDVGAKFNKGEVVSVVESLKAAGDVYAPFDLEIVEVNSDLDDQPELMNEDAFEKGFIAKIKALSEVTGLLSPEEYAKIISEAE